MEYQKFQEYIDGKGNLKAPVVDHLAKTASPPPKSPEKFATKGTNWEDTAAIKEKAKPYVGPGTDPGLKSTLQPKYSKGALTQGLLYKGDKKLVYEPGDYKGKETTRETWPKSKTEQFIDDTKDLSTLDFIDNIKEKLKLDGVPTIRETGILVSDDENSMEALVREIKRNGGFSKLMQEVLGHQEAYSEIALLMDSDESACNQLARAIRETTKIDETTDVPIKGKNGEYEDEEEEDKPMKQGKYQQTSPRPAGPPEMTPGGDTQGTPGEEDLGTGELGDMPPPEGGVGEPGPEMPQQQQASAQGQMRRRQHVMMRREHNLIKALQRYNII